MDEARRLGRLAGATYLVVVLTGLFSLMYVPSALRGDGAAGSRLVHMAANHGLYNAGTAAFLFEQIAFFALPLLLYRLLRNAGPRLAVAMAGLALISIPVALVGAVDRLDAIAWLTDPGLLATVTTDESHAMARQAIRSWDNAILVASLFWGLWLAPLGYLIVRSRAIPRLLGYLLMVGSVGYIVDVFGQILAPGYADSFLADYATLPAALGEVGTCLWLLVLGARPAFVHAGIPTTGPTG